LNETDTRRAMMSPTTLAAPGRPQGRGFVKVAVAGMLALGIAPVVSFFGISAWLDRDCQARTLAQGESGPALVWTIERQICPGGVPVVNVLVAPRGKTLALAGSFTGTSLPLRVIPANVGHAVVLAGADGGEASVMRLPLKATGRPSMPLVVADGVAKR
jgi:hypothetical protein